MFCLSINPTLLDRLDHSPSSARLCLRNRVYPYIAVNKLGKFASQRFGRLLFSKYSHCEHTKPVPRNGRLDSVHTCARSVNHVLPTTTGVGPGNARQRTKNPRQKCAFAREQKWKIAGVSDSGGFCSHRVPKINPLSQIGTSHCASDALCGAISHARRLGRVISIA